MVEIGEHPLGPLDAARAAWRHADAERALATALDEGLFRVVTAVDFVFHTYGDTIEELRDHVAANWRDSRISDAIVESARSVPAAARGRRRPRVVEHVRLTILRVQSPSN